MVIAGSSTILPILKSLRGRLPAAVAGELIVRGGGSLTGLAELRAGRADVAAVSMALPAEYAGEFRACRIGWDGVAVIVNAANPVPTLDETQVQAIYQGRIDNWSRLGGSDAPIRLIAKRAQRSTRKLFDHFFAVDSEPHAAVVTGSNAETIVMVATDIHALGYVSIGAVTLARQQQVPVQALPLRGVVPSPASVASGEFPLRRELNLVVRRADQRPQIRRLLDYMLSPPGQALVARFDYVPERP